jgi:small subunit ribosomal protein S7
VRRRQAPKRDIAPDPVFKSKLATRFINKLMYDGKKNTAARAFYGAIDILSAGKEKMEGFRQFEQAVENAKPLLEVKSRRVGGSNYQVPVEVRGPRKLSLAMRWLIGASRDRKEKTFAERLAAELRDCAKGVGTTVKKREDVHKMAEANKAFAHYRW